MVMWYPDPAFLKMRRIQYHLNIYISFNIFEREAGISKCGWYVGLWEKKDVHIDF